MNTSFTYTAIHIGKSKNIVTIATGDHLELEESMTGGECMCVCAGGGDVVKTSYNVSTEIDLRTHLEFTTFCLFTTVSIRKCRIFLQYWQIYYSKEMC